MLVPLGRKAVGGDGGGESDGRSGVGDGNNANGKKEERGGRAEAGGGRIRAGSGLPGAHFFSSPWLRRMISAELAILAGSGSDSARCLLCPSLATRVRSFHPGSGQEHGRVLNNLKVRVTTHTDDRAPTRVDRGI